MQEEQTEGIVLRSQDFKERHRLITLFTPHGLINLIVKGISRKNAHLLSLTTPFCHGEYHYFRSHSELLQFRDGTVLDDHFNLRQNFNALQTAGTLAYAILTSQMPGKPSPFLFALYKSYHKQTLRFDASFSFLASFYLKLLKHEGLLHLNQHEIPHFSSTEQETLLALSQIQHFSSLHQLDIPPALFQKITHLFHSMLFM